MELEDHVQRSKGALPTLCPARLSMRYADVLGSLTDSRILLLGDSLIGLLGRRLLVFRMKN
jgi:hypothetical protein